MKTKRGQDLYRLHAPLPFPVTPKTVFDGEVYSLKEQGGEAFRLSIVSWLDIEEHHKKFSALGFPFAISFSDDGSILRLWPTPDNEYIFRIFLLLDEGW